MRRRLLTATALGLLSAIVSRGSMLVAMLVLAHRLSLNDFGLFSLTYIYATSFGLFIAAGISQSAGALIPGDETNDGMGKASKIKIYQWLAMALCLLSAFALCLFIYFTSHTHVGWLLFTASGILLISVGLTQSFQGVLYAIGRHRDAAYSVMTGSSLTLVCLFLLWDRLTPTSGLLSIGGGGLVTCLMNLAALSQGIKTKIKFRRVVAELPRIRRSLYPLLATASLGSPIHSLCVTMLAAGANGLKEVAIFSASFQFYTVITFIPSVIANIALPFFAGAGKSNEGGSILDSNRIFWHAFLLVVTVSVIICGLTFAVSGHLLNWLLPERFSEASNTIRTLAIAAALSSVSVLFQQKLNGSHLFWLNFGLALIYSSAYVLFAHLSTKWHMGSVGLALAILLAFAILLPCQVTARARFAHRA